RLFGRPRRLDRVARRRRRRQLVVRGLPAVPRRGPRPRGDRRRARRRGRPPPRPQPHRRRGCRPGLREELRDPVPDDRRPHGRRDGRPPGSRSDRRDPHDARPRPAGPRRGPRPRPARAFDARRDDRRRSRREGVNVPADVPVTVLASAGETVFSGSLLLALPVALLAGLVSFASPCVLPLLPGYLGFLGGMAGQGPTRPAPAGDGGTTTAVAAPRRGRLLLGVALFVLGFTVVFVAY